MELPHLALTVIEDPDHSTRFHWLLLHPTGDGGVVEDFDASDDSFETALQAFDAGAGRWRQALSVEDEDADPVGDPTAE